MTVRVICGDSRAALAALADCSVDAVVSDPPYELGFMGKGWDSTGVAYDVALWREALRVLRPGGHLAAFGGTRTFHRMAVAIEDAGFEIRDQLAWAYGSGFPKSLDVSKAIDKAAGAEREVVGSKLGQPGYSEGETTGRMMPGQEAGGSSGYLDITAPATPEAARWQGWGTALKPAWEPICLARKPFPGTVAANVLAHGTGAINIDGCRVEAEEALVRPAIDRRDNITFGKGLGVETQTEPPGRFPANIIHDGSEEVVALFPDTGPAASPAFGGTGGIATAGFGGKAFEPRATDSGSAARFFYSAKAGKLDRLGSDHPTVKPVDLMRWLVRLLTPPGGTVLDPFAGTGSTGIAAHIEGLDAILIELRPEAVADIERRLAHIKGEGRTTALEKARLNDPKAAKKARGGDLPLFLESEQ